MTQQSLVVLLTILLLVVIPSGCGAPAQEVDTNVQITLERQVDKDGVHVWGTTTLPDGAILFIQISSLAPSGLIEWTGVAWDTIEVKGRQYSAYFNLKEWRFEPGKKRIWVAFIIRSLPGGKSQPGFIIEAFGEKGENMKGELVDNLGEEKIAEVADTFSWGKLPGN
ncbi:MAG: hypothetical protein DDT32_02059 [Syntrophomonadaceae bacterium]|nr:hypothetical protein [Bacillota bacterium]MBT9148287.1 hypothetical protein [Bacillota bacterium]